MRGRQPDQGLLKTPLPKPPPHRFVNKIIWEPPPIYRGLPF